jgi:hypothetical protein
MCSKGQVFDGLELDGELLRAGLLDEAVPHHLEVAEELL